MMKPTAIEQFRAELLQAQRGVVTMRSALDAASANTARADKLESTAREELAALEAERDELHAELGGKLAVRIVQGLPDEPIATHTALDGKVQAAKTHLTICANAAARLHEIHVASLNGLRSAETVVGKCADALLDAEDEELAAEIKAIAEVLRAKVDALSGRVPSVFDQPINMPRRFPSPAVEAALAMRPGFDALNTSVADLRAMSVGGGGTSASKFAARRAALIAGEEI